MRCVLLVVRCLCLCALCSLFVVCRVLFVVRCALFVVRVFCSLFVVRFVSFGVCFFLWFVFCRLSIGAFCVLVVVTCVLSVVCGSL